MTSKGLENGEESDFERLASECEAFDRLAGDKLSDEVLAEIVASASTRFGRSKVIYAADSIEASSSNVYLADASGRWRSTSSQSIWWVLGGGVLVILLFTYLLLRPIPSRYDLYGSKMIAASTINSVFLLNDRGRLSAEDFELNLSAQERTKSIQELLRHKVEEGWSDDIDLDQVRGPREAMDGDPVVAIFRDGSVEQIGVVGEPLTFPARSDPRRHDLIAVLVLRRTGD